MMNSKTNKIILLSIISASFISVSGYSLGVTNSRINSEKQYEQRLASALKKQSVQNEQKSYGEKNITESEKNESKKREEKSSESGTVRKKRTGNRAAKSGRNSYRTGSTRGTSSSKAPVKVDTSIPDKLRDGVYYGSSRGYGGIIKVRVTVKNGKLSDVKVLSHTETPGYYEKGAEIIKRIISAHSPDVDTVSGATFTSSAIKNAVAQALRSAKAGSSPEKKPVTSVKTSSQNKNTEEDKKAKDESKPDVRTEDSKIENLKDGTYEGEGRGFEGRSTRVSVVIEKGKIKSARILSYGDDSPYFEKAKPILDRIVEGQTLKVDTVSGATYSSNGIKSAMEDALKKADTVILVNGVKYSDALSTAPLANLKKAPILLVKRDSVPESVKSEIERLGAKNIIVIGGENSVSKNLDILKDRKYNVEKIYGVDRYETAALIADKVNRLNGGKDSSVLVNGTDAVDALSLSSIKNLRTSPILLTDAKNLSPAAGKLLKKNDIRKVTVFGGNKSVSSSLEDNLRKEKVSVSRISGADRYETSMNIAKEGTDIKELVIASGSSYADALTSSSYADNNDALVLIVDKKPDSEKIKNLVKSKGIKKVTVVGGKQSISADIENLFK